MGHELLTLPKYLSYVVIAPSLVYCVVFGRPLLVVLSFSLFIVMSVLRIKTSDYTFGICLLCSIWSTIAVLSFSFRYYIVLRITTSDYTFSTFLTYCIIAEEIYTKSRTFFKIYPDVAV